MEFTIAKEEFYKGLQRAQGVVSTKGAMPILANVLIEATSDGVNIFATNLDLGARGHESVENRDRRAPGQAEHVFYTLALEAFDEGFGAGHGLVSHLSILPSVPFLRWSAWLTSRSFIIR